ncbi:MAG: hypothetical protein HY037_06925 [Nitrospirae bacterium]|nr:hypothetical protein [Candidatus Troglogloeales bacterium]
MISEEEVKAVIASPDSSQETINGRRNAFKTMKERLLKVTYKLGSSWKRVGKLRGGFVLKTVWILGKEAIKKKKKYSI